MSSEMRDSLSSVNSTKAKRRTKLGSPQTRQSTTCGWKNVSTLQKQWPEFDYRTIILYRLPSKIKAARNIECKETDLPTIDKQSCKLLFRDLDQSIRDNKIMLAFSTKKELHILYQKSEALELHCPNYQILSYLLRQTKWIWYWTSVAYLKYYNIRPY